MLPNGVNKITPRPIRKHWSSFMRFTHYTTTEQQKFTLITDHKPLRVSWGRKENFFCCLSQTTEMGNTVVRLLLWNWVSGNHCTWECWCPHPTSLTTIWAWIYIRSWSVQPPTNMRSCHWQAKGSRKPHSVTHCSAWCESTLSKDGQPELLNHCSPTKPS